MRQWCFRLWLEVTITFSYSSNELFPLRGKIRHIIVFQSFFWIQPHTKDEALADFFPVIKKTGKLKDGRLAPVFLVCM
jgi:hypothetical protein